MNILKWHGLDIDPMKISESITTTPVIGKIDTAFNESTNESNITMLYPKIEAIHAGRTRNFNRYLAEKLKGDPELKSGVYSWTDPYPKPVIHNHDVETEATGRVYSASYSDITLAGRPGIIVTPKITQEKAIKDILEKRLLTVSIGASTNAAVCSVCGTDIINEGFCGHMRGEEYDGQVAEWIAGDLWFDELSWVNVPADSNAMITSNNLSDNSLLTTEKVVVKSVSDSLEKEENILEKTQVVDHQEELEETAVISEEAETQESDVVEETTAVAEEEPKDNPEDKTLVTSESAEETKEVEEEPVVEEVVNENTESAKITDLQAQLSEANSTVEVLKAANEAMAKDFNETVAGFLVDLRIALGKETNREEGLSKLASRSIESLRDSISDTLEENSNLQKTVTRTVENVTMPKGTEVNIESKELATKTEQVISNEDALISLLTGQK